MIIQKAKPIILVSLISFILIVPSIAHSSDPMDGLWIVRHQINLKDSNDFIFSTYSLYLASVLYQENDTTMYLHDNLFGTIRLEKNGSAWELLSPLTTNHTIVHPDTGDTVFITIESATLSFENNFTLTGTFNLVADDITGTSTLAQVNIFPQSLANGSLIENMSSDDEGMLKIQNDNDDALFGIQIDLPSNAKNLKIRTWGGQGDISIQMFYYRPDFDKYLSNGDSTDELITIPASDPGTWYALVFGEFSGVNLEVSYDDAEAFVARFYTEVLGRLRDPTGLQNWTNSLLDGSKAGSDVAYGFVFSQEFIDADKTDEEYVTILYKAFFNRDPDIAGFNSWMAALAGGSSREHVLNGFIYALEFNQLCQAYGIMPNPVTAFVTRFYQLCLNRDPDSTGLTNWTNSLLSQIQTGADVAHGFIDSNEFTEKNTTIEEYLTILYKAFFNRDPDPAGWNNWLAEFNAGSDRSFVLDGFLYSKEFADLCNAYGINPY